MALLPSTNITTTLVANTLGENSHDVGTLCSSNRINKWSVFKPIGRNISEVNKADWYKGNPTYNPYGIVIGYWTGIDINLFKNGSWNYVRPSGGQNSIYCLGDFRKYNHSASEPIQVVFPEKMYLNQPTKNQITSLIVSQTDEISGQIAIDIAKPMLGLNSSSGVIHGGVAIVTSSGNYTWRTASLGLFQIDFSTLASQYRSNFDVVLFLTNVSQETWTSSPLPDMRSICLPEETTRWKHYDSLDTSEPTYEPTWKIATGQSATRAPANNVTVQVGFFRSGGIFPIQLKVEVTSIISSYKTTYELTLNQSDSTGNIGETYYFNIPFRGLLMKSDGTVGSYTRAFPILVVNRFYDRANHLAGMGAFPLTIDPNYT